MEEDKLYMYFDSNSRRIYTPSYDLAAVRAAFYGTHVVYEG
jgi:hypothetical protein